MKKQIVKDHLKCTYCGWKKDKHNQVKVVKICDHTYIICPECSSIPSTLINFHGGDLAKS